VPRATTGNPESCLPVRDTEKGMDLDHNKAVVREFDDLGNEGADPSRLDQLCAPDIINHALAPGRPPGIEGIRDFLRSAQRDVYPSRWVSSNRVAENDLVVQFGSREHQWPGGSFRGFMLTPGRYTRDVMFAYRLADGRIAERWAIRDDLAMVLALGGLTSQD
jgi:ketosteroid isomerase-like protein